MVGLSEAAIRAELTGPDPDLDLHRQMDPALGTQKRPQLPPVPEGTIRCIDSLGRDITKKMQAQCVVRSGEADFYPHNLTDHSEIGRGGAYSATEK